MNEGSTESRGEGVKEHPGFEILRRSRARKALRPGSRWIGIVQLVIGLLLGIGIFDRVLMPLAVRHGADATVPNLRTRMKDDGEREILQSRLRVGQVIEVFDAESRSGEVIGQEPAAGARVRKGRRVNLVVSQGPPVRLVPDLAGKTPRSASLQLAQLDLRTGATLTIPSLTVQEGEIIGTRPARGESPGRSGSVDLLVSAGPQSAVYAMPDVRGLTLMDAVGRLRAAGIGVESGATDIVQTQWPDPGQPIRSGDQARLD